MITTWMVEISMMKGRDFIINGRDFQDNNRLRFSWWYVEILLWTIKVFMMTGWIFSWWLVEILLWKAVIFKIIAGWDIHDHRSRFSWWQVKILLWTVEIFMMTGQDFIINGLDFHDSKSWFYFELSWFFWWQVEIFMMTGWEFYDGRSRFFFLFWHKARPLETCQEIVL